MKKILLHACCGPCSTHCVEVLRAQDYEPTLFFSNSNIMPLDEYKRRLDSLRLFAQAAAVSLVEDEYNNAAWLEAIRGQEDAPEGGSRCEACFRHNLGRAAQYAQATHFDEFTTTLTVSPHKRSETVFEAGDFAASQTVAALNNLGTTPHFMRFNFKKNNGFLDSIKLSEKYGLYRQSSCGCVYSTRSSAF